MDARPSSPFLGSVEEPSYTPGSEERTIAMLSHILTLVAGFIPPLVIYLIKKDESKYIAEHAKESLNFQITLFIAFVISALLIVLVIGLFLFWLLGILDLIWVIVATVRAAENKIYRYPFNFRLIK
jgi:uncharacterized Tic20 family protein